MDKPLITLGGNVALRIVWCGYAIHGVIGQTSRRGCRHRCILSRVAGGGPPGAGMGVVSVMVPKGELGALALGRSGAFLGRVMNSRLVQAAGQAD